MKNIFKKISEREKKILLQFMIDHRSVLLVKTGEEQIHRVRIHSLRPKQVLQGTVLTENLVVGNQEISFYFIYEDMRYFFSSKASMDGQEIFLETEAPFFQLQRRAHQRFDIPTFFPAWVNISKHKGKKVFYTCQVLDVSAGGVRVVYENAFPLFVEGDLVELFLKIDKRNPIALSAEVRHMVPNGSGSQVFGLQFDKKDVTLQNRLMTLMVDIQRELYLKPVDRS